MEMNTKAEKFKVPELPVCGFEAVKALARKHPEKIRRLFFTQEKARFFGNVCKMLAAERRIYRTVEQESELEKLSGSIHHQGVVAMIEAPAVPLLDFDTLDQWVAEKEKVILCDRVSNSQNFGAIIRSAAFFGIHKIVISAEKEQCGITTSAYRIAQGGMESVDIYRVSNAAWFLAKTEGRMTRLAAHHRGRAHTTDLKQLCSIREGIVVVFGNEENGISREAEKQCDYLVKIPGTRAVESLNVAQAAAVFLYCLREYFPLRQDETAGTGGQDQDNGDDSFPDLRETFRRHRSF